MIDFRNAFEALTGNPPFPWQQALYDEWFSKGKIPPSCNLPTGLGKTSVIAVWLIALANHPDKMPRRLVYVVNRRTVVDQTTDEVEKYRHRIYKCEELGEAVLAINSPAPVIPFRPQPLALSTLRGQFADNREWSSDPSRPAVICGTVDMIGSRLLFSGYGVGMKAKPLHAGFLGQDALLVHDEAHLEPAFQELLLTIENEQKRERQGKPALPWPPLRVMELTATPRSGGEVFELTSEEKNAPKTVPEKPTEPIHHVWRRTHSKKALVLHEGSDDKKQLAAAVVRLGLRYKDDPAAPAVVVFLRHVETLNEVMTGLKKGGVKDANTLTLTGTMRGYERDRMATENGVFARFKRDSPAEKAEGTVYLVCTSAGEVGVDISADHMVCDLSTFDSMAQRFGRVNRYGFGDAAIDVVHPKGFDTKDKPFEAARERTLGLLRKLRERPEKVYDASPAAIGEMIEKAIAEGTAADGLKTDRTEALRKYILSAFAPAPVILPATDILFDAWALTTIKDNLPGRPPVEPYLHGLPTDWQPPETHVAWREEVAEITGDLLKDYKPADLLEAYPLKPHELLKEPSHRAFKQFEAMAKRLAGTPIPVWLVADDGGVEVTTLKELVDGDKERIHGMTVLLPPSTGGLEGGMLNGGSAEADDVADEWFIKDGDGKLVRQRKRVWNDEPDGDELNEMHLVEEVEYPGPEDDEDAEGKCWLWFTLRNEGDKSAKKPVLWDVHVGDVIGHAERIARGLPLDPELREAIVSAAKLHDHGKRRKLFQTVLGNANYPKVVLAKSGTKGGRVKEQYRHEFGSLLDVEKELPDEHRDLILHLIAAHHGRARPHFPPDEAFDPKHPQQLADDMAAKVPQRFARLQRKYGRWGLVYLESLLRAADWAASANPSKEESE